MKKRDWHALVVFFALLPLLGHAAVPAAVEEGLQEALLDAAVVGGMALGIIVAVAAFRYLVGRYIRSDFLISARVVWPSTRAV
mgnify:CR=1 FL=1